MYVFISECGVICRMKICDTGEVFCEWDPEIPHSKANDNKFISSYKKWRDEIFENWAKENGKNALVIDLGGPQ